MRKSEGKCEKAGAAEILAPKFLLIIKIFCYSVAWGLYNV